MFQYHFLSYRIDEDDTDTPALTERTKLVKCGPVFTIPPSRHQTQLSEATAIVSVNDQGEVFEFEITEESQDAADNSGTNGVVIVKSEELMKSEELIINDQTADDDDEEMPMFMDDETLKSSIAQLLDLVVDEETLQKFGWPDASIETVLSSVIEQCGQVPADYNSCSDYTTKMRENVKLLFTTVIDNESIKSMLNNNTIDEVIKHVLKLAKA